MSHELIYTSVPRGLRPGASGFCTVAMTAMPDAMAERLESLSGYRPVFPLGDPQAAYNPVIWAHWRMTIGDRARSVLSRVAFAGADYSQRSNKFAHHIVLDAGEQPPAGPAWVLRQPGVMESQWPADPQPLPAGRAIPTGDRSATICKAWQSATGDAGWAGVLADSFRNDPAKPAYLIFRPGTDLLPLIEEALALLPALRWQVTFSTYFTDLPMGATCAWRCVVAGTPVAKEAQRSGARALVIDLTEPMGPAPEGPLTEAARTGRLAAAELQASATGRPRLSSSFSGTASPRGDDFGSSSEPARGKRRLDEATVGAMVEEVDLEADIPGDFDTSKRRRPTVVRRGVPGWLVMMLCAVCLAAGGGGVYMAMSSVLGDKDQLYATELTRLGAEAKDLKQQIEKNANNEMNVATDKAALEKQIQTLDADKKALELRIQTAEAKPKPAPPETHTTNPSVATANNHTGSSSKPPDKAIAPTPSVAENRSEFPGEPPPESGPRPSRPSFEMLTKMTAIVLGPPRGPTGFEPKQKQPAPWSDEEKLGNVDRIDLLFPNGEPNYDLGSRTVAVEHFGGGALLKLTRGEKAVVASLRIKRGEMSLHWAPKLKPELVSQIRDLLENSTILGSNTSEKWGKLFIFRDADKKPISLSFETAKDATKAGSIMVPTSLVNDIFLSVQATGWAMKRDGPKKVSLIKKEGGAPLEITCTPQGDIDGSTRVNISTNWAALRQSYITKDKEMLRDCLIAKKGIENVKPNEIPSRDFVIKEVTSAYALAAKNEGTIKALKATPKKDRNRDAEREIAAQQSEIESVKPLIESYENLQEFEKQAEAAQTVGPFDGQLRLPNGLPVTQFRVEVDQKSIFAPWKQSGALPKP